MTVLSAQTIRLHKLLDPCRDAGRDSRGNSYGLSACGYDMQIDQDVTIPCDGRLVLASTEEHFSLPADVVGIVHDKSSLARAGLCVKNTVAEPGWRGHLTLELTNTGSQPIELKTGDAVAQVIFHRLDAPTVLPYRGKYQDQARGPQSARS